MNDTILDRLRRLRASMKEQSIDAFIIPGTDPHLSEYIAKHWNAREWISGFTGSAGTVVVTAAQAILETDSRYFLQAEIQLNGTTIELLKQGVPDTPDKTRWLMSHLPEKSTIAIDGSKFSTAEVRTLQQTFEKNGFILKTDYDPFPGIWTDRPGLPEDPIYIHPETFSGAAINHKISQITAQLDKSNADCTLLTALDEIAWSFNLRGSDVECNPVFISYGFVSGKERILFVDPPKITSEVAEYLKKEQVILADYKKIDSFLNNLTRYNSIFIDPKKVNYSLHSKINGKVSIIEGNSPVALLKSVKNKTEITGFRNAMVRDGIALVKFFRWLDENIDSGKIKETTIGKKLIEFRGAQPLYVGESFSTIAGFNGHGAIVHYHATPQNESVITRKGFLLIDSGAQYFDGTTDITRTVALGPLDEIQKRDFTLVLKGHIAIATCQFPQGTRGSQIDILARKPLWDNGLNYLHGTGHGIGHFLNVHEGPQNIRTDENPVPLMPGMVTSNEPGVYKTGEYGIRTENLILTTEKETTDFGVFYHFETLTLFPIDKKAIDTKWLTTQEIEWLNNYHKNVYEKLSPDLNEEEKAWLEEATSPLKHIDNNNN